MQKFQSVLKLYRTGCKVIQPGACRGVPLLGRDISTSTRALARGSRGQSRSTEPEQSEEFAPRKNPSTQPGIAGFPDLGDASSNFGRVPQHSPTVTDPRYGRDTEASKATQDIGHQYRAMLDIRPIDLTDDEPDVRYDPKATISFATKHEGQLTVHPQELYGRIRAMHSEDVLELVATVHQRLDKFHLALALKRLFMVQYRLHGTVKEQLIHRVKEDSRFQTLCAVVARKGRHYSADIALDMLQFMSVYQMGAQHPAVQVFLSLMKYHINSLQLDQLADLCGILARLEGSLATPQTLVLKAGIVELTRTRSDQLTHLEKKHRLILLEYLGGDLSEKFLKKLTLVTQNYDLESFSRRDCLRFLGALARLQNFFVSPKLVKNLLRRITSSVESLDDDALVSLLAVSADLNQYEPNLLRTVGKTLITKSSSVDQKAQALGQLSRLSFVHVDLLMSAAAAASGELLQAGCDDREGSGIDPARVADLSESLANYNHWSDHSELVQLAHRLWDTADTVVTMDMARSSPESALVTLLRLLSLGLGSLSKELSAVSRHIKKMLLPGVILMEADHLESGSEGVTLAEQLQLLSHYEPDADVRSEDEELAGAIKDWACRRETLPGMLEAVAGGTQFVAHAVTMRTGQVMDHLMLLDSANNFMPLAEESDLLEDISESEHKRVGIKVFPQAAFNRNKCSLKAIPSMYIEQFASPGLHIVVVNKEHFHQMLKSEAHLLLKQRILTADEATGITIIPHV